jgi:hypothetical protein
MGWRLTVASDRVVFDDTLTECTTVVKSVDQIEIVDLHAGRGTGPPAPRLAAGER